MACDYVGYVGIINHRVYGRFTLHSRTISDAATAVKVNLGFALGATARFKTRDILESGCRIDDCG